VSEEKSPFTFLDFTLEEAQQADKNLIENPVSDRDGRICICGHPVARHTNVSGLVYCKPTRMECPCKAIRAVVEANDIRPFLRKTSGQGPLHALGRGLQACVVKEVEVNWLIEMKCDRCKKEAPLSPVPVTQRGISVNHATGFDALLCRECRDQV
jgi:hypothetical protein